MKRESPSNLSLPTIYHTGTPAPEITTQSLPFEESLSATPSVLIYKGVHVRALNSCAVSALACGGRATLHATGSASALGELKILTPDGQKAGSVALSPSYEILVFLPK